MKTPGHPSPVSARSKIHLLRGKMKSHKMLNQNQRRQKRRGTAQKKPKESGCRHKGYSSSWSNTHFIFLFFKDFIYLFMTAEGGAAQRHRQREKQAPCREPDVGLDPGSPGSHSGPKTALNRWATGAALNTHFKRERSTYTSGNTEPVRVDSLEKKRKPNYMSSLRYPR